MSSRVSTGNRQPCTCRSVSTYTIACCAVARRLFLLGCGPKPIFGLTTADDNRESDLAAALHHRQVPESPTPLNSAHQPRAFIVETGKPRAIVAFDLAAGKTLWKVDADVQSRIAVGGDFVVELEGKELVARDQARGAVRWKAHARGTFLGATADRDRAYATWHEGKHWVLVAYDGRAGAELWTAPAEGQLGAPAAQGGLVYAPYFAQWLTILDGATGASLARLRGLQDQISMLRVTSQTAYYGSARGAFVLDPHSVTGKPRVRPRTARSRCRRSSTAPATAPTPTTRCSSATPPRIARASCGGPRRPTPAR